MFVSCLSSVSGIHVFGAKPNTRLLDVTHSDTCSFIYSLVHGSSVLGRAGLADQSLCNNTCSCSVSGYKCQAKNLTKYSFVPEQCATGRGCRGKNQRNWSDRESAAVRWIWHRLGEQEGSLSVCVGARLAGGEWVVREIIVSVQCIPRWQTAE